MVRAVSERWKIGAGGFIGEVSLRSVADDDAYTGADVELTDLHVHPLRRGRGWGRELVQCALAHAQRRRWVVFLRAVPYGSKPASLRQLIAFYKSCGFKQLRRGDDREYVWRPS